MTLPVKFEQDRFFLRQRVRPMVNQYEVSHLGEDGKSEGEPVCFVQQKRMKLKEDLRAYADDTKSEEVFRILAQQRFDPKARYTVSDAAGEPIGLIKKEFGRSLLRSTWKIFDKDGTEIGWAQEKNMAAALFRRFAEFLPYVGGILGLLPIPYHFTFYLGDETVGEMRRIYGIRDRYVLDLSADPGRRLDRRLAVAIAVGMDALQAR